MMKHKNKLISVSLATIVLVAMVAVTSLSVSAAPTVKAVTGSAPALVITLGSGAAVVSSTDGNVYITMTGTALTPTWTSIGKPAGGISGDPAAVNWGGYIHVFVNSGGALWVKVVASAAGFQSQADWTQVPGTTLAAGMGPGVCMEGNNLDVFYVGSASHELEYTYQIGGAGFWSPPQNLGGVLSSSPSACSATAGVVDVFGRGQSGGLWQIEYAMGGFGGWNEVPGYGYLLAGTGPSAVYRVGPAGSIVVFVAGGSGQLYYQFYDGNTGVWHTSATAGATGYYLVGGVLTASPSALVNGAGTAISVMVRGGDGNLYWISAFVAPPPLAWLGWLGPIVNVP